MDSPILSLKEKLQSDEKVSSPMRSGLFEELKQHQKDLQIIVVENEIPSIGYDDVKVIEFTKSKEYGRYESKGQRRGTPLQQSAVSMCK